LTTLITWINQAARVSALIGGLVLIALMLMTVISVIGRGINAYGIGPVPGDFELVEYGSAFLIFWVLPWCQMRHGHVAVDVVARFFPKILSTLINAVSHVLMLIMAVFIARQLTIGCLDKISDGETSFILQMPVWWGMAAALPGAWLWMITALITLIMAVMPSLKGAGHDTV
jgi:TRAP-type C4-dicarboxylate transport system permease small subunit